MNQKIITLLCLLFLFLPAFPTSAQQEGRPSSLLPEIDPQDIEIRGEFEVRFPGISRQPILGFSPTTPIFRIEPDRMPYIESDREIVASVSVSELEPALAPEARFIRFAERRKLYSRAGYGLFNTTELNLLAETPLRKGESLALSVSGHDSRGHEDSDRDAEFTSFRDFTGDLQWSRQKGPNRYGARFRGLTSYNYSPLPGENFSDIDPVRLSQHTLDGEVRWQQLENAYKGWQSALGFHHYVREEEEPPQAESASKVEESRYRFYLNRFRDGVQPAQVFGFGLQASGSFYDTGLEGRQYWLTNSVGARYYHLFSHRHKVEAWLRLYQLYDPISNVDFYLYPDIRYDYNSSGSFWGGLRFRIFVDDPAFEKRAIENPFFLQHNRDMEHERGLHLQLNSGFMLTDQVTFFAGFDFRQFYNKGIYHLQADSSITRFPFFYCEYVDEAAKLKTSAGFSTLFPSIRTSLLMEGTWHYTSANTEDVPSGKIAYIPRWGARVQLKNKAFSRIETSLWMDFTGKRDTFKKDEPIDGFFLLGARSDIRFHKYGGIYVKALNILNQEYEVWQNYKERPFQILGGIFFQW